MRKSHNANYLISLKTANWMRIPREFLHFFSHYHRCLWTPSNITLRASAIITGPLNLGFLSQSSHWWIGPIFIITVIHAVRRAWRQFTLGQLGRFTHGALSHLHQIECLYVFLPNSAVLCMGGCSYWNVTWPTSSQRSHAFTPGIAFVRDAWLFFWCTVCPELPLSLHLGIDRGKIPQWTEYSRAPPILEAW